MRILFVTWDGPQVHYLESLFLPIFQGLASHGIHTDILQFRWGTQAQAEAIRAQCERAGCGYAHAPIRRGLGGLGPFASAVAGAGHVRRAVHRFGSDALMPRSLMPAIAVGCAGGARLRPILFDADGLAADERVDFAGLSPRGPTYRILKGAETRMVRRSVAVLVRSAAAKRILGAAAGVGPERFQIVANGRDGAVFHPFDAPARLALREWLGIETGAPLAVYAGSVGPQYRFDRIRAFAAELAGLRPDARLLVLSGSPELAEAEIDVGGPLSPVILRAAPGDVPRYLAAADVGLAFRADAFSMQAVAPVKLGEYLLCGVPAVGTASIGDNEAALNAGVFFDDRRGPAEAARWVVDEILPNREEFRRRARAVGLEHHSLERSIGDYRAALENLVKHDGVSLSHSPAAHPE